jgi:hypothetical protein
MEITQRAKTARQQRQVAGWIGLITLITVHTLTLYFFKNNFNNIRSSTPNPSKTHCIPHRSSLPAVWRKLEMPTVGECGALWTKKNIYSNAIFAVIPIEYCRFHSLKAELLTYEMS